MNERINARALILNNNKFCYAIQTKHERKHGGGKGQSEKSYCKHEQIEKFMVRQLPILVNKKGKGCIIDMHSGDGCETPHPQPDFFAGGSLKTTSALAITYARKYGVSVILCESNRTRRQSLNSLFGKEAIIIGNHYHLLDDGKSLSYFPWLLIINDPNGYSHQGVDVMVSLSTINKFSDFIINVNRRAIKRCLGLTNPDHPIPLVRNSYKSGVEHRWMLEPENWRIRLGKRQVLATNSMNISNGMESQILLVSNFIAGYGK